MITTYYQRIIFFLSRTFHQFIDYFSLLLIDHTLLIYKQFLSQSLSERYSIDCSNERTFSIKFINRLLVSLAITINLPYSCFTSTLDIIMDYFRKQSQSSLSLTKLLFFLFACVRISIALPSILMFILIKNARANPHDRHNWIFIIIIINNYKISYFRVFSKRKSNNIIIIIRNIYLNFV